MKNVRTLKNYQIIAALIIAPLCLFSYKKKFKGNFIPQTFFHFLFKKYNDTIFKKVPPIFLNGEHDKIINYIEIDSSTVSSIRLFNCYNITVQNCKLISSKGNAIDLYKCKNITISNCYMENIVSGVYAIESQGINVSYNQIKNVMGPFPRGEAVQFNEVSGENNSVSYNKFENILGKSYPEDVISMFKTNGTAKSPVKIIGNWIRGGGPSKSGGGIMLGDNGGSYIVAEKNILVNPGQYGMAISGGTNMSLSNNIIYSKQQPFTNVGLYIWNQSKPTCALNTVSGNRVNWFNSKGEPQNSWNNGNCGKVAGWETNVFGAKIDSTILPENLISRNPFK